MLDRLYTLHIAQKFISYYSVFGNTKLEIKNSLTHAQIVINFANYFTTNKRFHLILNLIDVMLTRIYIYNMRVYLNKNKNSFITSSNIMVLESPLRSTAYLKNILTSLNSIQRFNTVVMSMLMYRKH